MYAKTILATFQGTGSPTIVRDLHFVALIYRRRCWWWRR